VLVHLSNVVGLKLPTIMLYWSLGCGSLKLYIFLFKNTYVQDINLDVTAI
jgi:hypothetical protein